MTPEQYAAGINPGDSVGWQYVKFQSWQNGSSVFARAPFPQAGAPAAPVYGVSTYRAPEPATRQARGFAPASTSALVCLPLVVEAAIVGLLTYLLISGGTFLNTSLRLSPLWAGAAALAAAASFVQLFRSVVLSLAAGTLLAIPWSLFVINVSNPDRLKVDIGRSMTRLLTDFPEALRLANQACQSGSIGWAMVAAAISVCVHWCIHDYVAENFIPLRDLTCRARRQLPWLASAR